VSNVHFSSKTNEWETPIDFYKKLDDEFEFTLDPCCTIESAKCLYYFTIEDDGLKQSWENECVFMNPPYGRDIKHWIKKAKEEALNNEATVVCLIPARTDTNYWHDHIFSEYSKGNAEIRFLRGRLKFGGSKNSAPFPSAVVVFRKDIARKQVGVL
jgi:site-specific DNA-methyltransferase (adenine-specific)